ncbi:MAG: hypothetical protein KGP28_03125 [Bdellovibrionales bacterium]|nr:hypothetical protein [Bdellovibrionales bacterium]
MFKQTLLSLVLILSVCQPTFAATKKKKTTVKTEAPAAVAAPAPAIEQTSTSSSSNGWTPSASFGLGSIESNFNLGVMGSFMTDVTLQDTSFRAGVKTGFLLGLGDVGTWVIPVMGSATYTFPNGGSLSPYIGVDLGIGIAHVNDITVGGVTLNTSSTNVKFAALIYPGAKITDTIYAELPFGSMSGGFIIFPSVGMRF